MSINHFCYTINQADGYYKKRPPGTPRLWIFIISLVCLLSCGEAVDPEEMLSKGRALLESGDVATALIELKNAVQAAPQNPEARLTLGKAYLKASNAEAALKEFKRARTLGLSSDELSRGITRGLIESGNVGEAATELALNIDESNSEWMTLQGLVDFNAGRFAEAKVGFERALELDPTNVDASRAAVRTAIQLGDTEQARRFVDDALKLTQDDFAVWILKGDLERQDKKYAEARDAYTKALEIVPNNPLALLQRSAVRTAMLDNDGALEDLAAIGAASNEDPRALYLRAVIATQKDQGIEALRYLRQVLQVVPNHRDSLRQAAQLHFKMNEHREAEKYLNRLLEIDPNNADYRRMLSAVQLADGRLETGIGDMKDVDIENLSDPSILALLGTAYLKHGKFEDGTRSLERAHELAPESVPIRTQLAFSKMRSGKLPEALKELEAIRKDDPSFLLAGILQAFGHASKKDQAESLKIANELIEQQPDVPVLYNVRGYLYDIFDASDKAVADFETALKKDPNFHPANFNLARMAMKKQDTPAARQRLQLILDRAPNQPQALLALASLLQKDGKESEAVKLWEQARENNPKAVEPRIHLARYYRGKKDLPAALAMAKEAYELAPYSPAAQFEFAIAKMSAGEPKEAVPIIQAIVERFPSSEQAMELLAQAYNQSGDAEALKTTLVDHLQRFPEAIKARVALARLHLTKSDYTAAQKLADELIVIGPDKAAGYSLQGDINFAQREIPKALDAYRKAHEREADSQSLLKLYAAHQQNGGDTEMLDEWLAEHDDDVPVRVTKAMADISAGRQAEAVLQYEKVLETVPNHIIALNNLAWIYDDGGDDRALEYARRAYEAAPSRPEIADTYGWIMLRKGNTEQAFELLSKALDGAPKNDDIRFHFASALAKSGDETGAIRELETILSKEDAFASRAQAVTLLEELRQ